MTAALVAMTVLMAVVAVLSATLVRTLREASAERARILNHLLAETPDKYALLQRADRPKTTTPNLGREGNSRGTQRPTHPEGL